LAVYDTVPLPVPAAVVGTVIQGVVVEAVQLQEVCTPNVLVPPAGPMIAAAGCSVMAHTAAPCVTGIVIPAPAIVMFACWLVGNVLEAAV
jgi:hypothetical protein